MLANMSLLPNFTTDRISPAGGVTCNAMVRFLAAMFLCVCLIGCGSTQPAKSRPGAGLDESNLPSVNTTRAPAGTTPPLPLKMWNPEYPLELQKKQIEGTVLVEFVINTDGRVTKARAVEWTHPEMAQAAVDAILRSEFRPATKDGKPIAVKMAVPIAFTLAQKAASPKAK